MSEKRRNAANVDEIQPAETAEGRHRFTFRALGEPAGSRQLGATHYVLPPGAVSYPFHYHAANEEAVYVLAGRGTARIGADRVPVRAGDWIAFPCGPEHAHQMVNDGDAPLEYLCISTMIPVDVWGYPESNKLGFCAAPPGGLRQHRYLRKFIRADAEAPYWEGEPLATVPSADE